MFAIRAHIGRSPGRSNPPINRHRCLEYWYRKTWQMNILWQIDPPQIENRCLEYHYTKLGRQTYFGQWSPTTKLSVVDNQLAHDLLEIYVFNKSPFETAQVYSSSFPVRLSRWTYFGWWTPHMKLSVVDNHLAHDLLEIYVFNKSPSETAQVYSSVLSTQYHKKTKTKKSRIYMQRTIDPPENFYIWMTFYPWG